MQVNTYNNDTRPVQGYKTAIDSQPMQQSLAEGAKITILGAICNVLSSHDDGEDRFYTPEFYPVASPVFTDLNELKAFALAEFKALLKRSVTTEIEKDGNFTPDSIFIYDIDGMELFKYEDGQWSA